ncbi:type II toxin-antitoxin system VapC family toxin [Phyllobacterium myrsinacearum]|uniref:Uncharacterized protein n=1 Tax=Phyllobacterium myrsinacearum TaxID=28101 RepID=A0A839F065_9HYPH|nr:hypothetical protein [Phyllobacterium myrsinacearum]MBA8882070.1 hypothetical protein [Phyllobacterium myrsinacearum]
MEFDLQAALRALKPEKKSVLATPRSKELLSWVKDEPLVGGPILLDTCVYLDVLQGKTDDKVDALLTYRLCHHSSVCLAELTHVFGRLDPAHPNTRAVLKVVEETIDDMGGHRLHAPSSNAWGWAGILAGLLVRLTNSARNAGLERKFLNDALVLLQARALGAAVLTANVRDFDYLSQIIPDVKVINYDIGRA